MYVWLYAHFYGNYIVIYKSERNWQKLRIPAKVQPFAKEIIAYFNRVSTPVTMENVRFSIIENDLKWHSESHDTNDLFFDKRSISSENSSNSDAVFSDEAHEIFLWQQQHQMIWDQHEIEETLSLAPGSLAIFEMVKSNCFIGLQFRDANLALLYSSIYGCIENVLFLLDRYSADPNCKDLRGRTPLHFACCRGNAHIAKVLLDRGGDPNRYDGKKEVTPLHCAASAKSVECILLLLKRKAHINIGIEKRSALHFAIDRNAVECVETLLKYGADPNTPQVYTETPLHTACALGFSKCVELLLNHGADVRSQFGEGKLTALHLAAENDYVECVRLLLEHGADVDCRNASHQTPLHLACLSQSIETVDLLIRHGANVNAIYRDGRTALHAAIVKQSRSLDCCNALLKAGANVNKADNFGYTPLHIAALNEFSNCVYTFIEHGADITARTMGNVSALSFIVRRTPEIIPKLTAKMDSSIKVNDHEIGDVDCEIKLDFRLLVPPTSLERGETELLLSLIEVGQKRLLMHPLCETFLFLKWRRIRKFFLMSLLYHAIYVILFTMYIVGVYARNCDKNPKCEAPGYISTVGYFVIILNLILMGKECFQMAHGLQGYAKYWENWLQWAIVFGVLLCVTPEILVPSNLLAVPTWQHHVAAIVVLLVWLELMMLVGRFPIFGVYVQMFTKVAGNFCKFLLAYICLLIAFCLSFSVLFNDYPPFENITWSLLKAITMMSGELEFEDIFYGDIPVKFPVTSHILFLCFVLLVTVILTNLMVGLAVSDIQGLQVSATLDRLVRQAELISRLESLFFSRLLRRAPVKLMQLCKRSALLRTSRNKLQFMTRPNDPRDNQLPEDIKLNIYKLVAERRDRNMSLRRRKLESNYNMFNQSLQRQYEEKKRCTAIPVGLLADKTAAISTPKNSNVNNKKLCNDLKEPNIAMSSRENDCLLRPRSATNVHDQLMAESEVAVKLKSQVNGISDVRAEVLSLREQLREISHKLDSFAESASKKLTFTAEEMCRIKIHLEQKASFQY
ncbi:transient receptor potential channel pyrexia isoform X2 [Anastrepha ludens]|uniref:transient receptor potential channel pyrexia isoform X2 n=1 Tax=Anastrepha ludens TaxID=28586 RepID=UPI0023B11300|nr:transient receptor potential channel pyrexia isoform X2 [Anastrepha ludens]